MNLPLDERDPCTLLRPCVGCGFCCKKGRCMVGQIVEQNATGRDGDDACPYLHERDGRYWCAIAHQYAKALSIGEGCCSSLNTARREMLGRQ